MKFGITQYLMIGATVLVSLLPRILVGCALIGFARWLWRRTGHRGAGPAAEPPAAESAPAAAAPAEQEPAPAEPAAEGHTLARRLRQLRTGAGYSQELLADRLGVSRQAVSKWETGTAEPSTANLLALADLYGITVDELLRVR